MEFVGPGPPLVGGRVDERWATSPGGLGRLFLERWSLALAYFSLALGLFLALGDLRVEGFAFWRTWPAAVVSAAVLSLPGPLCHHLTGSPRAGWAAGFTVYAAAITVAGFWCPLESHYQLWLPFAGVSDAAPLPLALSKLGYGLVAVALLGIQIRVLAAPERLLARRD